MFCDKNIIAELDKLSKKAKPGFAVETEKLAGLAFFISVYVTERKICSSQRESIKLPSICPL